MLRFKVERADMERRLAELTASFSKLEAQASDEEGRKQALMQRIEQHVGALEEQSSGKERERVDRVEEAVRGV